MNHSIKPMIVALSISTMLVIFNIIAVTQGTSENYFGQIEQFIVKLLPQL